MRGAGEYEKNDSDNPHWLSVGVTITIAAAVGYCIVDVFTTLKNEPIEPAPTYQPQPLVEPQLIFDSVGVSLVVAVVVAGIGLLQYHRGAGQ